MNTLCYAFPHIQTHTSAVFIQEFAYNLVTVAATSGHNYLLPNRQKAYNSLKALNFQSCAKPSVYKY